ncbi:roadblock/LC7 domain-containing protein [Streptomyces sp. NPDC058861]|uniref:roadblock/LC7 domain-containing protein n=1 Tax=Streptomyces sp. NPDC058861 TaxID=3346653 RepID=UPI0036CBE93E
MNSSTLAAQVADPSWVLDPITAIPDVRLALIISADGIRVGTYKNADENTVETVSAVVSALHGAGRAAAVNALGANPRTPISTITVQLDADPDSGHRTSAGTLMVMPAGANTNAYIAAAFGPNTPMGIIAQTMAKQAKNLGERLMAVSARNDGPAS